jgi:hypothetical protein
MDNLPYYDWNTGKSIQPWAWLWDDEEEEEWEFMNYESHLHSLISYEYESQKPKRITLNKNKILRNSEKIVSKIIKITVITNKR